MLAQVPPEVQSLTPFIYKALVGLLVGGLGALMLWPFRAARKEWKSLKENTAAIHEELIHQRSNHLEHIQANGEQQITLLTKVADLLDGVRLDLKEQTGYIKAQGLRTARSRAKRCS